MSKHPALTRRHLLQGTTAALAASCLPLHANVPERRFQPQPAAWRTFELTTTVVVADVQGATQLWLPLPDVDTPYQRPADNSWTGNASSARIVADPVRGVRMLHAEFAPGLAAPTLVLSSRVQTRDRATDWSNGQAVSEDAAVLRHNLAPTELLPVDGIVRQTALKATQGARSDSDKVRALYSWVLDNAHREPTVRGCGVGDIKTMLETRNLGGKCADLNAVFVGMCRAVGVPARDVYGLRVAPSAFGYRELGGNPVNLKGAQHCRAEVFLRQHGWVAMDPADVLKVMRQETPDWIKDPAHPLVAPVAKGLYGGWEGNWVAFNTVHDIRLPGAAGGDRQASLPFLMYPQGENASGRFDSLAPDSFRYTITARELAA